VPLALRRARGWPVPVLIMCGIPRDTYDFLGFGFGFAPLPLAPAIALATVADRSGPVLRWLSLVGTAAGVAATETVPGHGQPYESIFQAFIFGTAWVVGVLSRSRRAAIAATARRAEAGSGPVDVPVLRLDRSARSVTHDHCPRVFPAWPPCRVSGRALCG
jgi:hypothetical protein